MADLTCGEGGSNGAEIIERINELTKLDPTAALRLAAPKAQTFADGAAPALMECFDTVVSQINGFTADGALYEIANGSDTQIFNDVRLVVGVNAHFTATEELELYTYINDVQYSAQPLSLHGLGDGKGTSIFWETTLTLSPLDKVTIKGKNGAAGALTVNYLRATLKIEADWKETLQ